MRRWDMHLKDASDLVMEFSSKKEYGSWVTVYKAE